MTTMALGFRVKSGCAIAVAVAGRASAPRLVTRRIVDLCDPAIPETRQPYHDSLLRPGSQTKAALGEQEGASRELARRIAIVQRCAERSVAALLKDEAFAGVRCRRAGLVVGSVIDPGGVGNLHIRAHASEGQLFRTALADALKTHGIDCHIVVEKLLPAAAVKGLGRTSAQIVRTVAALGKTFGGPWRAEEKTACTAAWLLLP